MPELKFTRDRRGYENTFLVHTARRRGRERSRILYWFRTPPHVKVGRAALDEDAIRLLEEEHPDIAFDWDRILEAQPPPAPESEDQGRPRGRTRDRRREAPRTAAGRPVTAVPPAPRPEPVAAAPEPPSPVESPPAAPPVALPPNGTTWAASDIAPDEPTGAQAPSAAERALGSDGLSRLRARYAEVLSRIHTAHDVDAAVRDQAALLAERLNPDAWVTPEDVQRGLDGFEPVLAELAQRVGPPRRRTRRGGRRNRRRRGRPGDVAAPTAVPGDTSASPGPDDGAEADDPDDGA